MLEKSLAVARWRNWLTDLASLHNHLQNYIFVFSVLEDIVTNSVIEKGVSDGEINSLNAEY